MPGPAPRGGRPGHAGPKLLDAAGDQRLVQLAARRLARARWRGRVDAERGLQRGRAIDGVERVLGQALHGLLPGVEALDDRIRDQRLRRDERIVGSGGAAILVDALRFARHPGHPRVLRAEHLVGQPQRVHLARRLRDRRRDHRADHRLGEGAVEREVDLRDPRRRLELALVGEVVRPERANIIKAARLAAHDPFAGHEVGIVRRLALRGQHRLVEAGGQHVDQLDVRGELVVFLPRDPAGNEDAEMADVIVDGVDDGLAPGADVVDAVVEVEDPVERLLRRGDVVALGAEDHDRRADGAQVDRGAVPVADVAGGEVVADEELVDDPLHLLGVEGDMGVPPLLELEVALGLGVDPGPEVVLLGPEGIGRVLRLEVLHERRAVEDPRAEIARERRQPRAAEQTAGIAHRVRAADPRPVGERRAGDDDRAEKLGPQRGDDHHRPAGLAVADDAGLALGLGVAGDHRLEEGRLGACDIEDGLAGDRLGQEADEIGRVPGLHRDADLAVGLEAADARPMAGARVDDDERTLQRVDRHALGRDDAGEQVVDRPGELAPVHDQLGLVIEDVRRGFGGVRLVLGGALAHHVEIEDRALPGVGQVFRSLRHRGKCHVTLSHVSTFRLPEGRRVRQPSHGFDMSICTPGGERQTMRPCSQRNFSLSGRAP